MIIDTANGASLSVPIKNRTSIRVSVKGSVNNPGEFRLLPGMTLEDLYHRVGGLAATASKDSIVFLRESVKDQEQKALDDAKSKLLDALVYAMTNVTTSKSSVSVQNLVEIFNLADQTQPLGRVVGDLSPGSQRAKQLVLLDGDTIYVRPKSQTISVMGEVQASATFLYHKKSKWRDYVSMGGGFSKFADKSSVYVISANGQAHPLSGRRYRLTAGDTIVVPKKVLKVSAIPMIQAVTKTVSDIALTAAALSAVSK